MCKFISKIVTSKMHSSIGKPLYYARIDKHNLGLLVECMYY